MLIKQKCSLNYSVLFITLDAPLIINNNSLKYVVAINEIFINSYMIFVCVVFRLHLYNYNVH